MPDFMGGEDHTIAIPASVWKGKSTNFAGGGETWLDIVLVFRIKWNLPFPMLIGLLLYCGLQPTGESLRQFPTSRASGQEQESCKHSMHRYPYASSISSEKPK
jgi:hypothetical protein